MKLSVTLERLAVWMCALGLAAFAGCSDNRNYSPSAPTPFPTANSGAPSAGALAVSPLEDPYGDYPTPQPEPPAAPEAIVITITTRNGAQSFLPNPAEFAGQPVVFRNADVIVHRVILNDGTIDTGDIAPGGTSAPVMMPPAGANYHCVLHPDMVGSVTVPGMPPPADPPPPPPGYEPPPTYDPPYYDYRVP